MWSVCKLHVLFTKKKKEKKKKKKICEEAINGDTWNLEYLEPPPTTP